MCDVTILHHHLAPVTALLVPLALLLLLLDPVPLVLTPGVVGWRTSINQFIQKSMLPPTTVLPGPEHREVGLQGLQQLIHHITASLGTLVSEWIMMAPLASMMMPTNMVTMPVSTVWPGARSSVSKNPVIYEFLMMWVKSPSSDCSQDRPFMILAVRTVRGVDKQERRAFSNIQVRIVLVSEMCLKRPDRGPLVSIADADQLVRVAAAPGGLPHYLPKLAELLSYLTESADVEVEKRYAVQAVHITVNVPGRGWREEQISTKQLRHLRQWETVQAV
jgi:hypothetical protein